MSFYQDQDQYFFLLYLENKGEQRIEQMSILSKTISSQQQTVEEKREPVYPCESPLEMIQLIWNAAPKSYLNVVL